MFFRPDSPESTAILSLSRLHSSKNNLRSPADERIHHKISWKWLHPLSTLRRDIQAFISGTALLELPKLSSAVSELVFIPVVERVAEAEHSLLHRKTVHRSVSGAYVSLSLRSHEVMNVLETSGPEFLASFAQLADVNHLATSLHMREHPLWHDAANTPASARRQCADTILYTLDSHVQYGSTEAARSQTIGSSRATETKHTTVDGGAEA